MPADDADGAAPVAMLSYQAWQRDYGGDPSVIGSSFSMNMHPVTIIGVTPQAFYGDRLAETPPDFYLPISQEPTLGFYSARNRANLGWLFLVGRVKPGVAIRIAAGKKMRWFAAPVAWRVGRLSDCKRKGNAGEGSCCSDAGWAGNRKHAA